MYCRRRRTRCTFSAVLTTWNQAENARISSRATAGARSCVPHDQLHAVLGVAVPPADRGLPVALDEVEQRLAALVPDHLADELAERVHVVAQRRVLDREEYAFAGHGRGMSASVLRAADLGAWRPGGRLGQESAESKARYAANATDAAGLFHVAATQQIDRVPRRDIRRPNVHCVRGLCRFRSRVACSQRPADRPPRRARPTQCQRGSA